MKKTIKGLGGKGKLTGKLIDELSLYYGLAIRRNSDSIEKMKNKIWATLYHKISTDVKPQHSKCPVGENSWCTWQKAKARNELAQYKHKPAFNQLVFDAVKPIYEDLSNDELLSRCLGGYTQNSNESYNAIVWSMAPKTIQSGKTIVDIAADIAACNYNDGLTSIMQIMKVLNLTIGQNCYNFCVEADARRVEIAERSMTDAAKETRKTAISQKKETEVTNVNLEGQLYMQALQSKG